MQRALKLARRGLFTTHPNPSVGCVIVKDNIIVGEGYHYKSGSPHAEVYALRMAGERARGAIAYVTLEPCSYYGLTPPCCEALISSGIIKVIIAMQDPNPKVTGNGLKYLQQAGIETISDLMINEAEQLNKGFLKRMRTGMPYLQLKLGASLDGRTAMASGESKWITSKQSRYDVQYMRAQSHAILTSSTTVLIDNPSLNVRWHELNKKIRTCYPRAHLRQPLRIVIDSKNRIKPELKKKILQQPGEAWLIRTKKDSSSTSWPENLRIITVSKRNNYIDLVALMKLLGEQQINSIWVEAGATLAGALIQAKLVDELIIYLAPKLLGNEAKSLCVLPKLKVLSDAPRFAFSKIRPVGPDVCLHLTAIHKLNIENS